MLGLVIQFEKISHAYPICDTGNGNYMLKNKQDYLLLAKNLIDCAPAFARMSEIQYKNHIIENLSDNNMQKK